MKDIQIILLLYCYHQCDGRVYNIDGGDSMYYDLIGKEKVKNIQDITDQKNEFIVKEVSIQEIVNYNKKEYTLRDQFDLSPTTVSALLDVNSSQTFEPMNNTRRYNFWDAFVGILFNKYEEILEAGNLPDLNTQVCYLIGVTYKNAKTDIMDYEPTRYLYANIKEFEIGYLVEEIIVHYQIAVELFHIMLQKYGQHKDKNYASTSYMLYMYTNILHQCKVVQHLCNMLHEIRSKYKYDAKETIFDDYHLLRKQEVDDFEESAHARAIKMQEERQQHERLIKERQKRKDMRNIAASINKMQQGKKLFEFGTTKKRVKGPFPLHYGWSIEDW